MKRGLVIGKFLPIHNGHIALINFAKRHCDTVLVSMSYTANDPIDPQLRLLWIKHIFKDDAAVDVQMIEDNFDDPNLPWNDRTALWASYIKSNFPPVDAIISSEEYGEPLAAHLHVPHIAFDPDRSIVPVSATLIREKPYEHWNYIPETVRPYFVKKICFYGPESTGKSTMSKYLAQHYNTSFVPEVARELISSNDFNVDDIIAIGKAQTERVIEMCRTANKILFCDTDLITTQIYSRHYLGTIPEILHELENKIHYNEYFLFNIDTPWIADHMRDLGDRRQEMFDVFKNELEAREIDYTLVTGSWEERIQFLTAHIDRILSA